MLIAYLRRGFLLVTVVASLHVAAAPRYWTLAGVQFEDGGIATGYVIYDDATGTIVNWNLRVSGGAGSFVPHTYYPGNSVAEATAQNFNISNLGDLRSFRIYLLARLDGSSATVSINLAASYEAFEDYYYYYLREDRSIVAGSLVLTTLPPFVDAHQHGLTGSWYEPATGGQGFAVQIIPDQTPGNGLSFVSWFTFDTVIGGAERQRWYTLQGPVVTGQPSASLTIYQNTSGNFNAPPSTSAQPVGTATLSFASCSSGSLTYAFTDGSGRSGTVPLMRLLPNVTCSVTTPYPTNADFAFSGSWYAGAATSGQGLIAEVVPNFGAFFLSWFTYAPNGANAGAAGQRWYTAQGAFAPGLRTIPVQIYETTGGKFDTPTPLGQGTVQVGSGTMTFQSCSAATFNYHFTGGSSLGSSGTITLGRVGPLPPGCT